MAIAHLHVSDALNALPHATPPRASQNGKPACNTASPGVCDQPVLVEVQYTTTSALVCCVPIPGGCCDGRHGVKDHEAYIGDRTFDSLLAFADNLAISAGQPHHYVR